ncbi:hypothetical protein DOY81_007624 [Sarcophaga bullata]|nr:hypothetical protein DOY81_007624 [Sarcophaga bullata]
MSNKTENLKKSSHVPKTLKANKMDTTSFPKLSVGVDVKLPLFGMRS